MYCLGYRLQTYSWCHPPWVILNEGLAGFIIFAAVIHYEKKNNAWPSPATIPQICENKKSTLSMVLYQKKDWQSPTFHMVLYQKKDWQSLTFHMVLYQKKDWQSPTFHMVLYQKKDWQTPPFTWCYTKRRIGRAPPFTWCYIKRRIGWASPFNPSFNINLTNI